MLSIKEIHMHHQEHARELSFTSQAIRCRCMEFVFRRELHRRPHHLTERASSRRVMTTTSRISRIYHHRNMFSAAFMSGFNVPLRPKYSKPTASTVKFPKPFCSDSAQKAELMAFTGGSLNVHVTIFFQEGGLGFKGRVLVK